MHKECGVINSMYTNYENIVCSGVGLDLNKSQNGMRTIRTNFGREYLHKFYTGDR